MSGDAIIAHIENWVRSSVNVRGVLESHGVPETAWSLQPTVSMSLSSQNPGPCDWQVIVVFKSVSRSTSSQSISSQR